jgi:cellulose synthase (UDP-forming)
MLTDHMFGDLRHPFFSELYEVVQSIFNVPVVLSTIVRPRSPRFKVTPKVQSLRSDELSPLAVPFYIMLIAALAALPFAMVRWVHYPLERDAVYITLFWNCFNLLLVLLCLGAVWEKRQLRRKHRIRTSENIGVRPVDREETWPAKVFDLSEDGVGFSMESGYPLRTGEQVYIMAKDSSGHKYKLRALLRRVSVQPGGDMVCGAEFEVDGRENREEIISYMYGDSQRWEDFWQRRRFHRENAWSGILYLALKGFSGAARNFTGLLRLLWNKLMTDGDSIWRALKPGVSGSEKS